MTEDRTDTLTLSALSAMAFVGACVAHEVLGHGGACVATGGAVTLLTTVYFKCFPSPPIVDAAGPSMNLVVALAAAAVLRLAPRSALAKGFLALLLAFNGFWGAGYFLFSGVTNTGDWAFVVHDLSPESRLLWRAAMVVAGILLYGLTMRVVAPLLPRGRPLVAAYLAAGFVACVSIAFFGGAKAPAMLEAAQESLLASLGLLHIALARRIPPAAVASSVPQSRRVQALGLGVVALFWLIQGRGYQAPNPSIERTSSSQLRWLPAAAHVER